MKESTNKESSLVILTNQYETLKSENVELRGLYDKLQRTELELSRKIDELNDEVDELQNTYSERESSELALKAENSILKEKIDNLQNNLDKFSGDAEE